MKKNSLLKELAFLLLCLAMFSCGKENDNGGGNTPFENKGSIYGCVTDFATGEPVKNAIVQLQPSDETSLTDSDGHFEFLELEERQYTVTVQKTGYTTNRKTVTTIAGGVVNASLTLQKNP